MSLGRVRRVIALRAVVRISTLATASPENKAVRCILGSCRSKPAPYSATGAIIVATELPVLLKKLLKSPNEEVVLKYFPSYGSAANRALVVPATARLGTHT